MGCKETKWRKNNKLHLLLDLYPSLHVVDVDNYNLTRFVSLSDLLFFCISNEHVSFSD